MCLVTTLNVFKIESLNVAVMDLYGNLKTSI